MLQKIEKNCKRASGGIAVIYKKELHSVLKFDIKKESQFVLWFQLSKTVLKSESDLVFGCVYIPPENSKYSSSDAFDEIESEMISIVSVDKKYIALIGYFNAKTGTLNDIIQPDDSFLDLFDIDSDSDLYAYMYDYVILLN